MSVEQKVAIRDRLRERLGYKWTPHIPTPQQQRFLSLDDREAFYGGAAGGGKALSLDTPLPTPAGWTLMGEVAAGDVVFGADGKPTVVHAAFDIIPAAAGYRLTFDDGSFLDACLDHKWLTFDAGELARLTRNSPEWRQRRRETRPSRSKGIRPDLATRNAATAQAGPPPPGTIRTTREIVATLRTSTGRTNHAIPVAGALDTPLAELPLDPYVLGVWLGDGTSANGAITTSDPEILDWFAEFSPRKRSGRYDYGTVGLAPVLRQMGLLGNKHVPVAYLRASKEQRLDLLRGLMDTDGHACKSGAVEFTNTKRELAEAVCELAISLGWKATVTTGRATINGKDCGPKYRVKWSATEHVFRLPRKATRQKLEHRRTTKFRYIVGAEPLAPRPMRCIQVYGGMYLAGRQMVPTHNSDALLMAALQYVDVPGYAAMLFRRTYADLSLPGALMERAQEWLAGTGAKWNGTDHTWTFPSGATLTFGYLETENHKYRYQGVEAQFIGFDELTQFSESQYLYLFSRLRRQADSPVPLRMRSASNPGGVGHDWVKARFVTDPQRPFIPAKLDDNPYLDQETYRANLDELDAVTREQLLEGDWDVLPTGDMFKRDRVEIVEVPPAGMEQIVRYWDKAGTHGAGDYTAGCKMARCGHLFVVLDMVRGQWSSHERERMHKQTAILDEADGSRVDIWVEQEPGSSGKDSASATISNLAGYNVRAETVTGSKVVRAQPLAAQWEAGNVQLVEGPWNKAYLDEMVAFPNGVHDDQVDASSGAFSKLTVARYESGVIPYA